MKIVNFFKRNFQTSDHSSDPNLIIHYYRNDYNTVVKGIRRMAEELRYLEMAYDERFQEMQLLSSNSKAELIITISTVTAYEHTVSFVLNGFYAVSLGRSYSRVMQVYQTLNRILANIKKGLN